MTQIQINGSDTTTLRLFHIDLPPQAIERFTVQAGTGEWPLKYGLGATKLRNAFVDVIDIDDLGGMTLSSYLQQAHGVTAAALKDDKPRIDSLRGHVIALPAQAFDGTSQTLTIQTPITHIGTYAEVKPAAKGAPLKSASAKGMLSGGSAPAGRGSSAMLKLIALGVGIVVLLALAAMLR
ncbi:hypothetical protein [Tropicibacter naphthalenivorans]|uniref:Aspartate carbamoyltransferase catalytic subunit n=1 Tax=Tropicibacter naphthalenivorans TaxID=441103 RepID=A0A0P1G0P7_9RHOB|nr:hypothetical protein [Tropicibacter naphthalenivorans]CUH75064.1 hypothetical protein TRN7648_00239 [Tropicibacter naphthalenivorans]SMC46988.1 hypothetical protein SAMN04488093_101641 [Tropicibacter naphthalenivorans]